LLRKFAILNRRERQASGFPSAAVLEEWSCGGPYHHRHFREEIEAKVRVYAPKIEFHQETQGQAGDRPCVIIFWSPVSARTTLAEMLSFSYLVEGWEYIAVRSLDDGFAKLRDATKQIFFFDDFLGTAAALEPSSCSCGETRTSPDSSSRVRSSKNARFVLTTRRLSSKKPGVHLNVWPTRA